MYVRHELCNIQQIPNDCDGVEIYSSVSCDMNKLRKHSYLNFSVYFYNYSTVNKFTAGYFPLKIIAVDFVYGL